MERDEAPATGRFWNPLSIGLLSTVVGGLILLVIEYKSGYFNSTRPAPLETTPDSQRRTLISKEAPLVLPKEAAPLQLKPEVKAEPLKQPEPKEPKASTDRCATKGTFLSL